MTGKEQAVVVRRARGRKPKREENAEAKFNALLHAASEIVGEHGGIVECESVPRRTNFRILLPLHQRQGQAT